MKMEKSPLRRFLLGTALALLPIVLYYCLFLAFEPNNYFGLHQKADGTGIMAALRAYGSAPQNRIILGDSRLAKLDEAQVTEATGHSYANLSYGGASLQEQLDILDWALAQNPHMEQVLFMASFYPLNQAYDHDRNVVAAVGNPFVYVTNLGYNLNMLTNLLNHLTPGAEVGGDGESMEPADYTYVDFTLPNGQVVPMRETMARHVAEVAARSQGWALNQRQLNRLVAAIDTCTRRGIAFVVVLPPASAQVQRYVIDEYGIRPPMVAVVDGLQKTGALVLDYEIGPAANALRDDQFYDGFHLDLKRGLPQWTKTLFADIARGGNA